MFQLSYFLDQFEHYYVNLNNYFPIMMILLLSDFCTIELTTPLSWNDYTKPICFPENNADTMPMHCWQLQDILHKYCFLNFFQLLNYFYKLNKVQRNQGNYATKYAPLKACENGQLGKICTENKCNKKEDGDPLLCLGSFQKLNVILTLNPDT